MKLLIADDHMLIRKGIIQIISAKIPDVSITEADNGAKVLQIVREEKFDAIIMDVSMPELNGLDALKQLRINDKTTGVLMLSMHSEDHYGVRSLKAGANGYLTKTASPDELIEALRTIAAGRKYITTSLAEKLAGNLYDKKKQTHESLSDREFAVLKMIASGKQVSQIAKELNLSVPTVSTYRLRILTKMGMKTNAELTHYAISNQVV